MSLDLAVPTIRPISVRELSAASATAFKRLLCQFISVPVIVKEVKGQSRILVDQGDLISDRLYLISLLNDESSEVELIQMRDAFDLAEKCPQATGSACISIHGAATSQLKPALAAAIAIAVATLQHTNVYDDAQNWTVDAAITPDALVGRLAVKDGFPDLQRAAADFCGRMSKPVT